MAEAEKFTGFQIALAQLQKEANEALVRIQREAEEALGRAQREAEEAKGTLARVERALLEEQIKVEKLREEQRKEQETQDQRLNSTTKKLEEAQLEITEKDNKIKESTQVNEDLRKENEEMAKISRRNKENYGKICMEKEQLEENVRKSTSTISQLEGKLSTAEATNCELQDKQVALQEKYTEIEDKLKEEITKSGHFKTALEESKTNFKTQESQLMEAVEIINELSPAIDQFKILETRFENAVQRNGELDEQVIDLLRTLAEKTSEAENVHRDLNTEREEKSRLETNFSRCQESLQNCNLELTQFIKELKLTIGFANKVIDPDLDSILESLSQHVQSKYVLSEDNLKELQGELAKAKETVLGVNEHLHRKSVEAETMSMPPPPPDIVARRAVMPSPPASKSGLPDPQSPSGDNIPGSSRDVSTSQEMEAPTDISSDFHCPSSPPSLETPNSENNNDEIVEVTLFGCKPCGRTFLTWAELYHHQKVVHTVEMSKKVVQQRASSVKSLSGSFITKQKKKKTKDTSKFKIKQTKKTAKAIPTVITLQKKTRSGTYWNTVAPATVTNDENQNEDTLRDGEMLSSSVHPELLDQDSQYDNQSPSSSSNQNVETISPQHRPDLNEIGNVTVVGATVLEDDLNQDENTLMDEIILSSTQSILKLRDQNMQHNGDQSPSSSNHNGTTESPQHRPPLSEVNKQPSNLKTHCLKMHKEVLQQLESTTINCSSASDSQPPKATSNHNQFYYQRNVEGDGPQPQEESFSQNLTNQSSAAPSTSRNSPRSATAPSTSISRHHPGPEEAPATSTSEHSQAIKKRTNSSKKYHYLDMEKEDFGWFCVCGLQYINKNTLTEHIAEYSGDKKFDCNICFQWFKLLSNLQSHQKIVHHVKEKHIRTLFGCQHCGKIYLSQGLLLDHISHFHPGAKGPPKRKTKNSRTTISNPTSVQPVPPPPPSFHDHQIDISCVKIENVDPEMEPFTYQNTTAVQHGVDYSKVKARSGGSWCKCGVETTGKYAKQNLRNHITYFNSTSNFECPHCQQNFKATYRLKEHMRYKHNLEYTLVVCSTCAKVFENKVELRKHMKSQPGCHRKRKRIENMVIPATPAPHRAEEYLEELQQQNEEATATPTVQSTTQHEIFLKKKSLSSQEPQSLPTLPKKKHAKDMSKRNVGYFCICGLKKRNEAALQGHITSFNSGKYECELCGHRTHYPAQLRRHMKSVHKPAGSHQLLYQIAADSSNGTDNQTDSVEPQPSTSKGLPVRTNDLIKSSRAKRPSIIISSKSLSILPNNSSSSHLEPCSSLAAEESVKNDEDLIIDAHLTYEPCKPQVQHEINPEMQPKGRNSFEGKLICKTCGMSFLLACYFRSHMLRVHKIAYNISNVCKTCGENFATNMQLYEHFKKDHNNGHILGNTDLKYTPPTTFQPQPGPSCSTIQPEADN